MGLDIIIPVYNEGENIIKVMDALKKSVKTPFRAMICYDFDDDNTIDALKDYPATAAECKILFVKNQLKGVHGAILTGFDKSDAEAVLVIPADDDYNAGIVDTMYNKFKDGFQVVAASRFMKGGCMHGAPWLKDILVRIAAYTLYYLGGLPVHDPSNGYRLFSRKVLDEIKIESSQGFVYSIELLVKAHRLGFKIDEVPAQWFERVKGQSRFRLIRWLPYYLRWYFYAFRTTWLKAKA